MEDNKRQDEELAALTDALLEGRETPASEEIQSLREVIMTLKQTIQTDEEPSALFQRRLTQRVSDEYDRVMRTNRRTSSRTFIRLAGLAAALMLVFAFVWLVSTPPESSAGVATAFGDSAAAVIVVGLAVVGVGIAYAVLRNRR